MSPYSAPPKPVLSLRVGVTGHRPDRLGDDERLFVEKQVEAMLGRIRQQLALISIENAGVYAGTTPGLRVISALAEGADRLVVAAALRQSCEVMAMLPFPRDSYRRDFVEPASRDEFDALLRAASTVVELDGQYDPPETRNGGYASVGMNVVRQSDVVIAIWDGSDARGHGGTAEIIEYALRSDCPVVWFPSAGKSSKYYGDPVRLLLPDRSVLAGAENDLLLRLAGVTVPPADLSGGRSFFMTNGNGAAGSITQYFAETRWRWPTFRVFDLFLKLMTAAGHMGPAEAAPAARNGAAASAANQGRAGGTPSDDFVSEIRQQWSDQLAGVSGARGFHDPKLESLAAHYAWLDRLSTYYAGLYRSAYLTNYLLAAGAVMAAATLTHTGSIVELCILVAIFGLTYLGMSQRWHQRWIEYRELAERLRATRYLRIVASPPVTPQLPPHLGRPNDAEAQTGWLYRAVVRECGLPSIVFEKEYFEQVRRYLIENEVSDQIRYHHRNGERLHVFDHRLHVFSVFAFGLALVVGLLHLWLEGFALTYLAILLPTVGAALFGIRNQGEFHRVSQRSKRMEAALSSIRDDLDQSADAIADRVELEAKAQVIAKTMLSETSDWQMLLRARPLELPA